MENRHRSNESISCKEIGEIEGQFSFYSDACDSAAAIPWSLKPERTACLDLDVEVDPVEASCLEEEDETTQIDSSQAANLTPNLSQLGCESDDGSNSRPGGDVSLGGCKDYVSDPGVYLATEKDRMMEVMEAPYFSPNSSSCYRDVCLSVDGTQRSGEPRSAANTEMSELLVDFPQQEDFGATRIFDKACQSANCDDMKVSEKSPAHSPRFFGLLDEPSLADAPTCLAETACSFLGEKAPLGSTTPTADGDSNIQGFLHLSLDGSMSRVHEWVHGLHSDLAEDETEQGNEAVFDGDAPAQLSLLGEAVGFEGPQGVVLRLQSADKRTQSINLSSQALSVVPSLGAFHSLRCLSLVNNCITCIPAGLIPRSVNTLDLSRNGLLAVDGLRDLTRLKVLKLNHNRIARIGHGLASCSSLKQLHLADNKVSEVEGLHRLLKLQLLDLSFNRLTTTKSLSQLAANYGSLQVCNILGNPVMVNVGADATSKYVRGLLPQLVWLNDQRVKSVLAREAGPAEMPVRSKGLARPSARVSKTAKKSSAAAAPPPSGRHLPDHGGSSHEPAHGRIRVESANAKRHSSRSLPSSGRLEPSETACMASPEK